VRLWDACVRARTLLDPHACVAQGASRCRPHPGPSYVRLRPRGEQAKGEKNGFPNSWPLLCASYMTGGSWPSPAPKPRFSSSLHRAIISSPGPPEVAPAAARARLALSQWWAHLVGALRVHPHKHCANDPPQKDRGFARGARDTAKRRDAYREVRRFVCYIVVSANPIKRIPSLVGPEHDVRIQPRSVPRW
jgi:hypothetical protein